MFWLGLLIDIAIMAGLVRAFIVGSHSGLEHVVYDCAALIVASIFGLAAYQKLSHLLSSHLHVSLALAPIVALMVILAIVAGIYALGLELLFHHHRRRHHPGTVLSQTFAAMFNGLKYLVVVIFVVIIAVGLPLPEAVKSAINASHLSSAILSSTNQVQADVNQFLNQNLASTFNFLTVEQESDTQSLALGFRVSNGRVRPDLERQMLILVNNERASRGLAPLTQNTKAQAVAIAHSQDMLTRGYFSHYTPAGQSPFVRMRGGGVIFLDAGENLALAPTLQLAHNGLMNSPPHRANILEPTFHSVGIGIVDAGRYGLMVTQDFTN